MNFEIGDRITCINAGKYPNQNVELNSGLIEGRDYIVYGVDKTPCCNSQIVDVGLIDSTGPTNITCRCGSKYFSDSPIDWKLASRFIKKEESKKKEVAVSAIKLTRELSISEN